MIRPRYLWADEDRHGNVRFYVKRKGHPKIRIHAEPGSEAFWEAYTLALRGTALAKVPRAVPVPPAVEGTFRWLSERYMGSSEFLDLDVLTRAQRRNVFVSMWEEPTLPGGTIRLGGCALRDFSPVVVRLLRDRKRDAKEAANHRLKVLRGLFRWALADDDLVRRFGLPANPARDVPPLKTSSEGHYTWTLEDVEKYEARHAPGTTARRALLLLMLSGQRKSDIIRFGKQHRRVEPDPRTGRPVPWFKFTQHKNRNRKAVTLELPILPLLDEELARCPAGDLTFLVTEYGKPFSDGGFGNRFRKWCDDAGLPQCSAHGVRKAGACIAAENGATEKQLMEIFGWRDSKMAALYIRKARQKRIAGDSMHLIQSRRRPQTLPLFERLEKGGCERVISDEESEPAEKDGGLARNRTGVQGFAVLCVTTPPRGLSHRP